MSSDPDQLELFTKSELRSMTLEMFDEYLDAWASDPALTRLFRLSRERGIEVAGYL